MFKGINFPLNSILLISKWLLNYIYKYIFHLFMIKTLKVQKGISNNFAYLPKEMGAKPKDILILKKLSENNFSLELIKSDSFE